MLGSLRSVKIKFEIIYSWRQHHRLRASVQLRRSLFARTILLHISLYATNAVRRQSASNWFRLECTTRRIVNGCTEIEENFLWPGRLQWVQRARLFFAVLLTTWDYSEACQAMRSSGVSGCVVAEVRKTSVLFFLTPQVRCDDRKTSPLLITDSCT